jgi:hypothetical protein
MLQRFGGSIIFLTIIVRSSLQKISFIGHIQQIVTINLNVVRALTAKTPTKSCIH